jgi:UDP-glucose 4-epimerase
MKTLAVTGATGFIGRRVVAAALQAGWDVRVLVRSEQQLTSFSNCEGVVWDIGSREVPKNALSGVVAVCHLAAFIPSRHDDPMAATECMQINALGTLTLLQAAKSAGVGRFVNFSGGNCYMPSRRPTKENAPLYPAERAVYYLASKLAAELYVAHWGRKEGLSTCTLRVSSVYGPGMAETAFPSLFSRNALAGLPLKLANGGLYGADLVYVDDVALAALAALEATVQGPVNVGSGKRTTVKAFAKLLLTLVGGKPGQILTESGSAKSEWGYSALDITAARDKLGFNPTPLGEGIMRYLEVLRARP